MIARNKSEVTQFFFKVYIENEFHTFFSKKNFLNRNGIKIFFKTTFHKSFRRGFRTCNSNSNIFLNGYFYAIICDA